jgi:16S rRNA (guanine527-N7)-methyltransferase
MHELLIETLRDAQRLGFFGAAPIEDAVDHARAFVHVLDGLPAGSTLIDIGSGGGLPGLVLADAFAHARIMLVDRREKRADFLRRAVSRLAFAHVEVRTADVASLAADVAAGRRPPFDVVTARGFGPPVATLRLARQLVGSGGRVVISEPPEGDRWDPALLAELGVVADREGAVRVFLVPS